jgi:hypothetical protein
MSPGRRLDPDRRIVPGRAGVVGGRTVPVVGALAAVLTLVACDTAGHHDPSAPGARDPVGLISVVSSPPPAPTDDSGAVAAAMRYQLTHCAWDWHTSFATHLDAETALATANYAQQLRAQADPVTWDSEVVGQRQTVTCTVLDARLAEGAPDDPVTAYVRLVVLMHVTSDRGSFQTGELSATCLMRLVDGQWLVDGPFEGG